MYAPDGGAALPESGCLLLGSCALAVVEIIARRHAAEPLRSQLQSRGLTLPALGQTAHARGLLALSVQPNRWLLLSETATPASLEALCRSHCADQVLVLDRSSALQAYFLQGTAARALLSRSCRLDLDVRQFPAGCSAATLMAQVAVSLVALSHGMLLLTPLSTAQHLHEWLQLSAAQLAPLQVHSITLKEVLGDK